MIRRGVKRSALLLFVLVAFLCVVGVSGRRTVSDDPTDEEELDLIVDSLDADDEGLTGTRYTRTTPSLNMLISP
jgi:hypothetical protein